MAPDEQADSKADGPLLGFGEDPVSEDQVRADEDEELLESELRRDADGAEHHGDKDAEELRQAVQDLDLSKALATAIAQARGENNLSQLELGSRVGVDQSVISSWERYAATPSLDRIFSLDLAFGLQPGTLLVRAGLIKPGAMEAADRRAGIREPADVTKVEIEFAEFDGSARAGLELPPKFSVEKWLELVRTLLGDRPVTAVTQVIVTSSNDEESSVRLVPGDRSLQEVLRLAQVLLEAQGDYDPDPDPRMHGRFPAYDPAEEPF